MNIQCGDTPDCNIAFHFNPRFEEQEVVRNTKIYGDWPQEERDQPYFPFHPNHPFTMCIQCTPGEFQVSTYCRIFTCLTDSCPGRSKTSTLRSLYLLEEIIHLKIVEEELSSNSPLNITFKCIINTGLTCWEISSHKSLIGTTRNIYVSSPALAYVFLVKSILS